jgi:hypothetical protein
VTALKISYTSLHFSVHSAANPQRTRIIWQKLLQQDIKNSRSCVCLETLRSTAKLSVMVSGLLVEIHTIHLPDSVQSCRYNNLFDTRNINIDQAFSESNTSDKALRPEKFIEFCSCESSRQSIDMQQPWMAYRCTALQWLKCPVT